MGDLKGGSHSKACSILRFMRGTPHVYKFPALVVLEGKRERNIRQLFGCLSKSRLSLA